MIDLRVLGTLEVQLPDAGGNDDIHARPKPLALLVYLTLARPRGFHMQDQLLALFWPESDTSRALLSLRQAVHVLRRALGDAVVVRRGRTELGVAPTLIASDVQRFEDAITAGDHAGALALYQGELLPAFHVPEAPEFERWLSAERARLKALAIGAVCAQLKSCRDANDDAAGDWAVRWAEMEPLEETVQFDAMGLLGDLGRTADALRLYDAFQQTLAGDGYAPSGRIAQRAAALRARTNDRPTSASKSSAAQSAAAAVASDEPTHLTAPEAITTAPRSKRKSLRLVGIAALLVIAAGFIGQMRSEWYAPAPTENNVVRLAILPFTIRGAPRFGYLREGLVDLFSAKLDGVAGLATVDPRVILSTVSADTTTPDDANSAMLIARRLIATQFLQGSVVEAGDNLAVTASLYDANGHRLTVVNGTAHSEAELLTVVDELARAVVAAEYRDAPARLERIAASTSTSIDALKAFLDGERDVRAGHNALALDAFSRAIAIDSTFALAHYRLSTTALWSTQSSLVRRSIALALRYADRLPRRERLALEARQLVERGSADTADYAYRALVASYPDDVDAWTQLGELGFHTGPWRGRPLSDSRQAFEQVLHWRSADVNALVHLARLAAIEGRSADAASFIDRVLTIGPDPEMALEMRGLHAAILQNPNESRDVIAGLRKGALMNESDDALRLVAWRIATYSDNPRFGQQFAALLDDPNSDAITRLHGEATMAHMLVARGQFFAAEQTVQRIEQVDSVYAAELRANFALSTPNTVTPGNRQRALAVLIHAATVASPRFAVDADSMRAARLAYLAGTLALRDGNATALHTARRVLEARTGAAAADAELATHWLHQLRARERWQFGDAAGALRDVESGWPIGSPKATLPLFQGESYTQAHERFFRGVLLATLHRDAEAERWFGAVADDQGASLILSEAVHLARADLNDRKRFTPITAPTDIGVLQ